MTQPPSDRPIPYVGASAPAWGPWYAPAGAPWVPAGLPPTMRRSRRGVVVAAAVVGALLAVGGGYAGAAHLVGGGTQPEDVLPADTLGFVRIDLDPSAGQKLAMMSLLETFPDIGTADDSDLRSQLLAPLMDLSETELDDGGFVLGSDASTAQALAAGDGGLGVTDAFREAVVDPDTASGILYVDLATVRTRCRRRAVTPTRRPRSTRRGGPSASARRPRTRAAGSS